MVAINILNLPIKLTVILTGRPTKRRERGKNNIISAFVLSPFLIFPNTTPEAAREHIVEVTSTLKRTNLLQELDGQV